MIKIDKKNSPNVLKDNYQLWTAELEDVRKKLKKAITKQDKKQLKDREKAARKKYRHTEIVNKLTTESHQKCCYCEGPVGAVVFDTVEHFVPWSKDTKMAYKWSNLMLVCWLCNLAKSDYYVKFKPLVNPTKVNPRLHIGFLGELAVKKNNSKSGGRSIKKIELNRIGLLEERKKKLKALEETLSDFKDVGVQKKKLRKLAKNGGLFRAWFDEPCNYSACASDWFEEFIQFHY